MTKLKDKTIDKSTKICYNSKKDSKGGEHCVVCSNSRVDIMDAIIDMDVA